MNLLASQSVVIETYGRLLVILDSEGRLFGVAIHDRSNDRFSVSLCGAKAAPARRARGRARLTRSKRPPISAAPSMGADRVDGEP